MELTTDATGTSQGPLHHFWNVVLGAGRANEGLRTDWQSHLDQAVKAGRFSYLRFHGLFHDDMFVYRETDGLVDPYFHYIDVLFDALLDRGIRPFVELGFMPAQIARTTATVMWWKGNGSPSTDNDKWARLVELTVRHWIDRYGEDEVCTWYFEVWNEPNLKPFFEGTRSEYFELYRRTVATIKTIDQRLRVGGPATSNFVPDSRFDGETEDYSQQQGVLESKDIDSLQWKPVWLEAFFKFCEEHELPVDFVSCHPYPTDWALDAHSQGKRLTRSVDATATDLRTLRRLVEASPYPNAEIHLTEWSSSSSPRDFTHDYIQAATFVAKANLDSIGLVDSLAYWVFTDVFEESGAGQSPFHGGFGMINQQGVPKPTLHAYRMLASLGDEILLRHDHGVITRNHDNGAVQALIHHYPPEVRASAPASFDTREIAESTAATGRPQQLTLQITSLTPGAVYELEVLDADHGYALPAWQALGSPSNPTREDVAAIHFAASATARTRHTVGSDGVLRVMKNLQPWSVALLTCRDE